MIRDLVEFYEIISTVFVFDPLRVTFVTNLDYQNVN